MGSTLENATALPDFLCARVALQSGNNAVQKNTDDHFETAFTEPGSIELTEQGGLDDLCDVPPLLTIKARCPDPGIDQHPFPFEKKHFHPNL
jgi:hypothetical protein